MKKQLKIQGNYLIVVDTETNKETPYPLSNVQYRNVLDGIVLSYINSPIQDIYLKYEDIVDSNGNEIQYVNDFLNRHTGCSSLAKTDTSYTAWNIPKVSQDKSILHGMFTFNVPKTVWREVINDTKTTGDFINSSSVNGKLVVTSGTTENDTTILETYRNPRYEPNRGLIYSDSLFIPNPSAQGIRYYGVFTEESGVYFKLDRGRLYGCIQTKINGVVSEDAYLIPISWIDLSKGNIYDIQMQWRGAGGYRFFINQKEVLFIDYLGKRTELTMFNPANPLAFKCVNLGDEVTIECGCVDVSTEGGEADGKTYGSVSVDNNTGSVAITGYNVPIIAIRSKSTVNGLRNTRDTVALSALAYSDQKSVFRIWSTRDFTDITENDQVWRDYGDGHLEYMVYDTPDVATPMTFNTTKAELVFSGRVDADSTFETTALFGDKTDIYLTPTEMFVFTLHRENGIAANVGVTFEFAEEI